MSSIRAKIVQTIRQQKMEARRAAEKGFQPEDNLQEHQDGDGARQAAEASGGDSSLKSREIQAKTQNSKKEGGRGDKKVQPNRKASKV